MKIPRGGVAFFDSGVGGLTVLAECQKVLPDEIFYYYGDNERAPYGNLPAWKIKKLVARAVRRLAKKKVKAVVLACNTATAVCADWLRRKYSFPIVGTEPALLPAAAIGGVVFVFSTRATYESDRFQALLARAKREYPSSRIYAYPCDGWAGRIEEGIANGKTEILDLLPQGKPDVVVLGCTHYVYVAKDVADFYGCQVVDGNRAIARRLQSILMENFVENGAKKEEKSGKYSSFSKTGKRFNSKQARKEGKSEGNRANVRSHYKDGKVAKTKECRQIFFLGRAKNKNENVFKQMFVK